MKTLADLKRRLHVGAKATLVWSAHMPHKFLGVEREVVRVQTNAVVFRTPDSRDSWLTWGKAKDYTFTENGFSVLEDGKELLRYEVKP